MDTHKRTPADETRAAWLASLKVGDKIVWMHSYTDIPRCVYLIQRETPKCWVIAEGWLVRKDTGRTSNYMTGIAMHPYKKGMEAQIARDLKAMDTHNERRDLVNRISKLSTKRLREIVAGAAL